MSKELGFNVELPLTFDAAVSRVREALKQEGFGVLTEIDLRAAFREKLGREFHPYVILGACNPPLAFSAISADPSIGLLLPCNVTVEWLAEGRTGIRLTDPEALLSTVALQGTPQLTSVARDARANGTCRRVAREAVRWTWRPKDDGRCCTRGRHAAISPAVRSPRRNHTASMLVAPSWSCWFKN